MSGYAGRRAASFRFRHVLYRKTNGRAVITINRPEVHNALDLKTLRELGSAISDAGWDDHVAVINLTGAGDKAFCTGADMKEWSRDLLDSPVDFYK